MDESRPPLRKAPTGTSQRPQTSGLSALITTGSLARAQDDT
jgi:hypothetical protein